MNLLQKIKNFVSNNIVLSFLFMISTIFFLVQHYFYLGWDFSAYVLNAEHFFYSGLYFEVYRAPLISLILGIFLFLGKFSEYVYILIVSTLFLVSTLKLSDALYQRYFYKYEIKKEQLRAIFYLFSLNTFLLYYGLIEGTELLALSFFELFLAYLILGKISGHFLGLAFLSRYNFLIFFPLLFLNRNYKKIVKNLLFAFLVIFPWLLYNFVKYGNWFTSIIDSYYLNIFSRQEMIQQFSYSYLLQVSNWLTPFIIAGLIILVFQLFSKKSKMDIKSNLFFLLVFGILIYDIYQTPFKVQRYLFNFVLPFAFLSTLSLCFLINKIEKKYISKIIFVLLIIFLISLSFLFVNAYKTRGTNEVFSSASNDIQKLGLQECKFLSPHWVPLNYYSKNTHFLYDFESALLNNESLIIFYNEPTMDDSFTKEDLENANVVLKTKDYMIITPINMTNQTCNKKLGSSSPMISKSCNIFCQNNPQSKKVLCNLCNFLNFKFS
jgi:hypothetical protein